MRRISRALFIIWDDIFKNEIVHACLAGKSSLPNNFSNADSYANWRALTMPLEVVALGSYQVAYFTDMLLTDAIILNILVAAETA